MKLNNRGIAITSILYIILVLAIILITSTLALLSNRKLLLDKLKNDVANSYKIYKNGEVVYFDVKKGKICTNYHDDNSKTGYNGIDTTTSNQNSCLKFYAFNDEGSRSDKINLILDHNTTATIAWNISAGSNKTGPDSTFLNQLKTDTDSWKGTITPNNYTLDQSSQTSGAKYTIDYSEYKARLITANEIAKITGNTNWDESTASDGFYLDTNTTTSSDTCKSGNITGCKYGWLYDRTNTSCTTYGCLNNADQRTLGYWTSTAYVSSSNYVWYVYYYSNVDYSDIRNTSYFGIRPVITVRKDDLKDTESKCYLASDSGTNIGDKIECGNQNFYIVSNDDNSITMLSQYNINIDINNPVQSENADTIEFADKPYWLIDSSANNQSGKFIYDENSTIYKYVEAYKKYLINKKGLDSGISVTIMSNAQYDSIKENSWANSSLYWLGTFDELSTSTTQGSESVKSSYSQSTCSTHTGCSWFGSGVQACMCSVTYTMYHSDVKVYINNDSAIAFTGSNKNAAPAISNLAVSEKYGIRPLVTIPKSDIKNLE